jgi:hypothetical protein
MSRCFRFFPFLTLTNVPFGAWKRSRPPASPVAATHPSCCRCW